MDFMTQIKDMTAFLAPYAIMVLGAGIVLWLIAKNKLGKNRTDANATTMRKVGLALLIAGAALTAIHTVDFSTTA